MNTALLHKRISTLERITPRSNKTEVRRRAAVIVDQLEILKEKYPDIIEKLEKVYETKFAELCNYAPEASFNEFTPERLQELILQACGEK